MKKRIITAILVFSISSNLFAWWPSSSSTTEPTAPTVATKTMPFDSSGLHLQNNRFRDVLNEFASNTIELKIKVDSGKSELVTFKEAVKIAAEKNSAFGKVYNAWQEVEFQNEKTIEKFKKLVENAEAFYSAAEAHASTITNESLRNDAMKTIKNSTENYKIRLKSTKKQLDEVAKLKTRVDDTMKYFEIVQSIQVIDEKIQEAFNEIDILLESLMGELQNLKLESENLLNSSNAEKSKY